LAASAVVDGDADHFGVGALHYDEEAAGAIGKFLGDEAADFAEGLGAAGEPAGSGRRRRLEGVGSVQAHRDATSRRTAHSQHELRG